MIALSVTGILLIAATLTLALLVLVIMQKEPPETTDITDRVLLVGAFSALGVALFWGGISFLGGVLVGQIEPELLASVWFSNFLYFTFVVLGWMKILRNLLSKKKK